MYIIKSKGEDIVHLCKLKRVCSLLMCVVMALSLLPPMIPSVNAQNGYDRGYDGGMAGDGVIYAHGLDVSAWQESGLNFQNFANAGYDYVILRCGTSYGKDTCFEEYYASAKAAGLDVGCYYYSYATSAAEAESEALEMISWMGDKVFEYPIYYDYEDPSQSSISGSVAATICYAFMDKLKEYGYLVGMYSMGSWLGQSWITSSGIRDTYEGWVAHVPSEEANSGINSDLYMVYHSNYSTTYGMYQYSFDTWVNGCGPFDANVCYKDYPSIVKQYGFNGYDSETWVEKAAFDAMVYRDRNPDLADMTDAELKNHWLTNGIKEGRASSVVFDLQFYRNNNPDLIEAFGSDYEAIYNHFITSGYKEYRKSSALFDGRYYANKYSDVATNFEENYLLHYMEHGMQEGRRASLTYDPNYYWFIRPDVYEAWPDDYEMAARHYAGHGVNAQTVAYDTEHPVVTDAVISDISAEGYTVTCKVTDNWGISKVVFPTWTVANDQDDLAENFMNTQKGTKDGDTYTFRVNASDHNNEGGAYITHIYAIDKGGNQVQVVLDVVTVEDVKIKLISASTYTLEESMLRAVMPGTSVEALLNQLANENLQVLDQSGNALSGAAVVGTGATINLYSGDALADSVTVVISGDTDGNALVDSTDYLRVKAAFLNDFLLTDAEGVAADVDGNGVIDSTDYMRIKAYFLGTYDLYG